MDKIKAQSDADENGIGFTVDGEFVEANRVVMFFGKKGIGEPNKKARDLIAELEPDTETLNAWRTRIGEWFVIAARGEVGDELEKAYLDIRDKRSFQRLI